MECEIKVDVPASVEDSDDSLLEVKELNDVEFELPSTTLPSLESILWDIESEEGLDNQSIHSLQNLTIKLKSMLYHCILQGISTQIASAGERVGAGLPTVITNSSKYITIGTSHGFVLTFNSEQKLCWCSHDEISADQGAVSAFAFNRDSTRLLAGFERGYILMLDANTGDVLRRLPDAHAPQTAVLHLRFTSSNNLALVSDSAGCIFSLNFSRRLGVRSWDSKCLFSGARGEVCCFEPLVYGQELLGQLYIVALATLSKVIIITIKPRLRVLYSHQLPRLASSLPLLSWQLVLVGKSMQPVLAWGRGNDLHYTRMVLTGINRNKLKVTPLRHVQVPFTMTSLHWIGSKHLALLDTSENLHLIEVRTQKELEMLELASGGLVYGSAHFKALAVGGGVSEAFALAGERACYNSLSSRDDQLLIMGTNGVQLIKLRTWHERILYLCDQGRWTEALNLAAEDGLYREKSTMILLDKFIDTLRHSHILDEESLTAAINCCIKLDKIDILCADLWDRISMEQYDKDKYYLLFTDYINAGSLKYLSPSVTQSLVTYLEQNNKLELLSSVLLSLDLSCLDLHQVLSICRKRKLYDAWIHITTKTIGDYTSPLTEFLNELTPENHALGNTIIVYVNACLCGLGYPKGIIPERDVSRVKFDILRCLQAVHSVNRKENEQTYPYLRALLKMNIREFLNVIKLAFMENEFAGEMGLLQQQRLIEILIQVIRPPEFEKYQETILAVFIAKLITSNNLKVEEETLKYVITALTDVKQTLSQRDHADREQACIDLLHINKLKLSNGELLQIALESKCYKVAEFVYEQQKRYDKILECFLRDPVRKSEVFNYMLIHIRDAQRCIPQQFFEHFKELVQVDVRRCVEIIIEHFPNKVEEYFELVRNDHDISYTFLGELVMNDIKITPEMAEWYLEILCMRNVDVMVINNYLHMGLCRIDEALVITKKYNIHMATVLLLEQLGEFNTALELLLENNLVESAVEVCIRGADHLSFMESQALWLKLLKHPHKNSFTLREQIHSAASRVPPAELLELVSDAHYGDIKSLLQGMLTDCQHDIEVYNTTLKLIGKDLHQGLAKALSSSRKGIGVQKMSCNICQGALYRTFSSNPEEQKVSVCGCGHTFHYNCISKENNICPFCCVDATYMDLNEPKTSTKKISTSKRQQRPNVEGHF